jgi:hypothetical protein
VTATNLTPPADTDAYIHVINPSTAPANIQPASPLANGVVNVPYSVQFTADGSPAGSIAWQVQSGSLPPGITLSNSGLYSGTPTTANSPGLPMYSFTIRATNNQGFTDTAYTHTITQPPAITAPAAGTIAPNGLEGSAYTPITFTATGFPAPTWSVTSGALPPGLSLNAGTGVYDGTPTTPGAFSFTVTATNGGGTSSRNYTHIIDAAPRISLSATALTFEAPVGGPNPAPQSVTISNIGGFPFNWNITETGAQAANVAESPASGTLSAGQAQPMTVSVDVTGLAAATYVVTLDVNSAEAINSPRQITVTLIVNGAPKLAVSTTNVVIDAPENGPNPAPKVVGISNVGTGTLTWSAAGSTAWLAGIVPAFPSTVTVPAGGSSDLFVLVDTTGLTAAGSPYLGSILVSAGGVAGSPATINVTLNINASPKISLNPASLSFEAPLGGPNPPSQNTSMTNVGAGRLSWSAVPNAAWLDVSPRSGSLDAGAWQTLMVDVDVTGLAAGTYTGRIAINSSSAATQQLNVTLRVNGGAPRIGLNPVTLSFDIPLGGTPAVQNLTVTNVGTGTLSWSAADNAPWLTVNPAAGAVPLAAGLSDTITLTADPALLAAGTYSALVTVSDGSASNNPQVVQVTLNVNGSATVAASPGILSFSAIAGTGAASQTVTVTNVGGTALTWVATPSEPWITVGVSAGPLAAGASEPLSVRVSTAGLRPGTHTAVIVVSAVGGSTSPAIILPIVLGWAARRTSIRRAKEGRRP